MSESPEEVVQRPPILCNSVPKSGTHLLAQILAALPGVRTYHTFIASIPSVPYRERSPYSIRRRLRGIVSGELVRAHVFWHPSYPRAIADRNLRHYIIFRDPRDVVVSEAYYLATMNRWHRLHPHFRRLPDMESRFRFGIRGDEAGGTGLWFPDIGERYARFLPWIRDEQVCAVRFEDLVGDRQDETLEDIVRFWAHGPDGVDGAGRHVVPAGALEEALERAKLAIDPMRSHTFRKGQPGAWRREFTARNVEDMKSAAGELLIELGYEAGYDWG